MFTYSGITDMAAWRRFLIFVKANLQKWGVKYWCATWEQGEGAFFHGHLYLQFKTMVDKALPHFAYEGKSPHVDGNDYCGEGINRKRAQQSMDRGFFYVWADKIGTERYPSGKPCVEGNYEPCWTRAKCRYQVLGRWPEVLWKQKKLSHDKYEEYLFACRDGVLARKRNLDACRAKEESDAAALQIAARVKRIRGNARLFQPFPVVPEANSWLAEFKADAVRYRILIVHGPSRSGKTEWAKSLFSRALELKVGTLAHFPDGMRMFDRDLHDGIVLDDVRDLAFVVSHQEKLQGKYDYPVEFASTTGGTCAFSKDLFAVPIVMTINNSTKNLQLLATDDFLGNVGNRVLVTWPRP